MLTKTKEIAIATIALLAVGVIFGFLMGIIQLPSSTPIKSQEDVSSAMTDVGSSIDEIGKTLGEIDKSLG